MKKILLLTVCVLFFTIVFSKDYALIVGINQYEHLDHLLYAGNDAHEMSNLLEELGFEVSVLVDEAATRDGIIEKLNEIVDGTANKDSVLFFFSGHGMAGKNLEERGFFPVNANFKDIVQIPQEEIIAIMKRTAANKIIFLDACYQGSRQKDMVRNKPEPKWDIQQAINNGEIDLFIAASSSNKAALDGIIVGTEKIENGIATFLFLEGIRKNRIEDEDGFITNGEIAEYFDRIAAEVSDAISQKPEAAFKADKYRIHLFTIPEDFFEEEMPEVFITFVLNTDPSESRVFVDDMFLGTSPVEINAVNKEVVIKVVKDGYEIFETKLSELNTDEAVLISLIRKDTSDDPLHNSYNHSDSQPDNLNHDIYNSDVALVIGDIENENEELNEDSIIAKLIEKLAKVKRINILERKDIGTILEEKKLHSLDSSEREFIIGADYYVNGKVFRDRENLKLSLCLINTKNSRKQLFKNFCYGSYMDSEFTVDEDFEFNLEQYITNLIVFLRSPIKPNCETNEITLSIEGASQVKTGSPIAFDYSTTFENSYFFISTPEGEIEYIGSVMDSGEQTLSGVATLPDETTNIYTEYLLALGIQQSISVNALMEFKTIEDLNAIIERNYSKAEYALSFISYTVTRE
jgi:TolB-like protein